jgi:hypothetical protein
MGVDERACQDRCRQRSDLTVNFPPGWNA